MALTLTRKEEAAVLRRRQSIGRQKLSGPKLETRRAKPKHGQEKDAAYMGWLHEDLPCIACLVLGPAPLVCNPIEAAHQKLNRAERGWHKRAGRRGPHRQAVPICAYHHRLGRPCCDPAQEKFWAICGFSVDDVIDFNEALNGAFEEGRSGAAVVYEFARRAK